MVLSNFMLTIKKTQLTLMKTIFLCLNLFITSLYILTVFKKITGL